MEPSVFKGRRGQLQFAPVAGKYIGPANHNFADLTRRDFVPIVVHETKLRLTEGPATGREQLLASRFDRGAVVFDAEDNQAPGLITTSLRRLTGAISRLAFLKKNFGGIFGGG
jgi:hypothetical protein